MKSGHFSGDRPIETKEEDRLGYADPARHVADAIVRFASPEGFVLGLEGKWGSGKSSFVNLIITSLNDAKPPPEIVRFSPWLISTRMGLLDELFQEIGKAAARIPLLQPAEDTPDAKTLFSQIAKQARKLKLDRNAERRKLSSAINGFASHLSQVGKLAGLGEALGIPGAGLAGNTIQSASDAISSFSSPSLETEKKKLKDELRKLSRQIVIFVDDLDRLEPAEAGEVVRLVRAVADFPNVVYVLCYSREILAQSLSRAYSVEDGDGFIEKIVQVTFSVPKPEDFDLRRLFREELKTLFPHYFRPTSDYEPNLMLKRLAVVIDREGARTLGTPRDVNRVINALRLYAGPIIDGIDLSDMVWLQLVRIRNAKLFDWIESYLNSSSVLAGGGTSVPDDAEARTLSDLKTIIAEEHDDFDKRMYELEMLLPGIGRKFDSDNQKIRWVLFHELSRDSLADFVVDKRLGSSQHFRFYFALTKPSAALSDSAFDAFIAHAISDQSAAIDCFLELAGKERPQGGSQAEAYIDRLVSTGIEKIAAEAVPGVLKALASGMDKTALVIGEGDWGRYWIWDTARAVMKAGVKRIEVGRKALLEEIFRDGQALGWLTNLLRDETFARRAGDRQKDEADRLLTPEEYDAVEGIMRQRYQQTPPIDLMKTPNFAQLMFAWMQCSPQGEAEAKAWFERQMETDDGFLSLMEHMRGWASINGKVIHPLKTENIRHFTDAGLVESRIESLAQSSDSAVKERAERMVIALKL